MKKVLYSLAAVIVILGSSASHCNHSADAVSPSTSWWYVGSTKYTGKTISSTSTQITCEDANGNSFQLFFSALPTSTQTYNVVSESKAANNTLASNELAVEVNVGAVDAYLSTGNPPATVLVSVSSTGKISLNLPSVSVDHFAGGGSLGTTTVDGSVSQ